jgi:micrococcal nuclease
MYEYRVEIVKVIDGDTVDVNIDLGFGVWMKNERVRLYGIDTPESRTTDKAEKIYGNIAKQYLKDSLKKGVPVLRTHKDKSGKYGRILGEMLYINEEGEMININQVMIEKHLAVAYHGQSKDDVEAAHMLNRLLVEATINDK